MGQVENQHCCFQNVPHACIFDDQLEIIVGSVSGISDAQDLGFQLEHQEVQGCKLEAAFIQTENGHWLVHHLQCLLAFTLLDESLQTNAKC